VLPAPSPYLNYTVNLYTEPKTEKEQGKSTGTKNKNRYISDETVRVKVHEVSPEGGRICEIGRFDVESGETTETTVHC